MSEVAAGCSDRTYQNAGNPFVVALIPDEVGSILDIGCGAGDNAAMLARYRPNVSICGITVSPNEAQIAKLHMERVWICDVESEVPPELLGKQFDALVFSHVLEHLRHPEQVVARYVSFLKPNGFLVIAVPNIGNWRQRLRLLRGDFRYQSGGVMDETHLHFYTYFTADQYLLRGVPDVTVLKKQVAGSVPLWLFRRRLLPAWLRSRLDNKGSELFPNLFGDQILILASKQG
jgi:2-polyprenyl-3-methyl-5-hydroxy-6-metoxy-1,4-benzoquinol methylase